MSPETERALVEQAKGDPQAFALLYDHYVERIYTFLYRRCGDADVAQEITAVTFEKVLRHLPGYRWQGTGFCAWLYRIARNALVSHQRRRRFLTLLRPNQVSACNVEWLVESNEQTELLHSALRTLSEADREILILRFFEELSSAEVAEVLGCSADNVYVRLHRALKRLEKQFTAFTQMGWEGVNDVLEKSTSRH